MGYTKIPNQMLELFMTNILSDREKRVVSVVLRKTNGFNKKWDAISLTQFQKLTGIDRRNINRALEALVIKKALAKKTGNSKRPSSWRVLEPTLNELTSAIKHTSAKKVVTKSAHTKEIDTKEIKNNILKVEELTLWTPKIIDGIALLLENGNH